VQQAIRVLHCIEYVRSSGDNTSYWFPAFLSSILLRAKNLSPQQ